MNDSAAPLLPHVCTAEYRRQRVLETAFAKPRTFRRVSYFTVSSKCEWCGNAIASGTEAHVVDWAHLHPACFEAALSRLEDAGVVSDVMRDARRAVGS